MLFSKNNRAVRTVLASCLLFFVFGSPVLAQTIDVTGKVVDADSNPLAGVGVFVKGTTNGTVTDLDGVYTIKAPQGATLQFSCIGFTTQDVVADSGIVDVTLLEDTELLDEVVVVGYGTQKKGLVSGSVVTVDGDAIKKLGTTNVMASLYSSTPGVSITRSSGQSWSSMKVTVRGLNTTGDSSPLYVIDGVAGGSIDHLNPSDIESINILKDAASAAIYGARASAGVVFVTTRQGKKSDKVSVTLDSYYAIQQPNMNGVHPVGAKEYISLVDKAMADENAIPAGQEHYYDYENLMPVQWAQIQNGTWDGTDWVSEMVNENAPMRGTSLSVVGGSDVVRYSIGYSNTYAESSFGYPAGKYYYKRNTFRLNTDVSLWKKNGRDILKFGENLVLSQYFKHDYSSELRTLMQYDPLLPAYDTDGTLYTYEDQIRDGWYQEENRYNLLESNTMTKYQGSNYSVQANAHLDFTPTADWTFKSQLGFRLKSSASRTYTPTYKLSGNNFNDYDDITQSMSLGTNWTWENTAQYSHNFGDHHFDALAGQSIEGTGWGTSMSTTRQQTIFGTWESATIDNCNSDINSEMVDVSGSNTTPYNNLFSLFTRLNYNYKETYMVTAILRADGSSNFARGHRYGYFPSASAGWVITNEDFMDATSGWLDFLKLRVSWGQNGNCQIDPYQYLGTVSFDNYYDFTYKGQSISTGAYPDIIPNAALTWETTEQTDFGFDANFLDYRLNATFDLYRKDTKDWLVDAPALASYGTGAPTINGGAVRNQGFEVALGWNDHVGDFKYNANFSLSHNVNEVLYIDNEDGIIHGGYNVISNNVNVYNAFEARPGKPIGYFTGIASEGIFQNQAQIDEYKEAGYTFMDGYEKAQPGDVIWIDQNQDGQYDDDDVVEIGNPHPDYSIGFNFGFSWKGLDFSVNGSGEFGQQNYLTYHEYGWSNTDNYANNFVNRLWTGEGSTNSFPRFSTGKHNNFYCKGYQGDIWVFDADYVKIRNITVGYDLKHVIKNLPCEEFRVYFNGQNLFTFTQYDGMDPEVGYGYGYSWTSGIDRGFYPNPKVFQAGVSIKF